MFLLTFDTSLENLKDDLGVLRVCIERGVTMEYVSPDYKYNERVVVCDRSDESED